jgi:hypothetical protein
MFCVLRFAPREDMYTRDIPCVACRLLYAAQGPERKQARNTTHSHNIARIYDAYSFHTDTAIYHIYIPPADDSRQPSTGTGQQASPIAVL